MIYRKIVDSYSKGETDSLLDALKAQVNVNKTNIATNGDNITSVSNRLKTIEDAMSLYLKIKDAADIYLTKTVAASTYAMQATAVTHTANTAVGSATRPVYVDSNGSAKALSGTVGSATEPIYLLNGVFTKTSGGGGGQIAVTAGVIDNGGVIPVPEGFTRAQCHYAVWPTGISVYTYATMTATSNINVDQNTGKVTFGGNWYHKSGKDSETSGAKVTSAAYLCIAAK